MSRYLSGLVWLIITTLIPLLLLVCYALGAGVADLTQIFALTTGIFAYVWLLAALFLAGKPKWLDGSSAVLGQVALALASLPLSLSHAQLSPGISWGSLSGRLALMLLLAMGTYSLMFWIIQNMSSPSKGMPSRLMLWFNRLIAAAVGLIFVHVQLIESVRQNLPFMFVFYLLTITAFGNYLLKPAQRDESTMQQAKKASH
ncbi:hypothetical protein ACVRZR_08245 [Streptococcus entericus]|uniref:hypothetical protein n=1 Tax=Streptococcus entericus TaxID=155680 RepID=UPI0003709865|nr:hypothetical protein [Streptococcus entericus]